MVFFGDLYLNNHLSMQMVRIIGQDFPRMIDEKSKPNSKEILSYIGDQASTLWFEIEGFLKKYYNFQPETIFYGKKYGWTVRYRKSGRTLCSLFPEKGAFTILITLGKKEAEIVLSMENQLSSRMYKLVKESNQLRDGRWLWIRVSVIDDIADIKKILIAKRKTKSL